MMQARSRLGRMSDERLAALVARGDATAFEAIYDRHHAALLAFCRHMLGNREDGEDALQQAFVRAHRSLAGGRLPDAVRPWLFAIARNRCLTVLAARREAGVPLEDVEPGFDGLADEVQQRAELRELVGDLAGLPDDQRGALVLAELGDLSHPEIAQVIGCPAAKVKALVFQARSSLIADRDARRASCDEIRSQLETARGGVLRRGPLRRHLRLCDPCAAYRVAMERNRSGLAIILPVLPTAGLKAAVLAGAAGLGGGAKGAAAAALGAGGASGGAGAGGGGGGAVSAARAPRVAPGQRAGAGAVPAGTGAAGAAGAVSGGAGAAGGCRRGLSGRRRLGWRRGGGSRGDGQRARGRRGRGRCRRGQGRGGQGGHRRGHRRRGGRRRRRRARCGPRAAGPRGGDGAGRAWADAGRGPRAGIRRPAGANAGRAQRTRPSGDQRARAGRRAHGEHADDPPRAPPRGAEHRPPPPLRGRAGLRRGWLRRFDGALAPRPPAGEPASARPPASPVHRSGRSDAAGVARPRRSRRSPRRRRPRRRRPPRRRRRRSRDPDGGGGDPRRRRPQRRRRPSRQPRRPKKRRPPGPMRKRPSRHRPLPLPRHDVRGPAPSPGDYDPAPMRHPHALIR